MKEDKKEIYADIKKTDKRLTFFQKRHLKHLRELKKKEPAKEKGESFFQKRAREAEEKRIENCPTCQKHKKKDK